MVGLITGFLGLTAPFAMGQQQETFQSPSPAVSPGEEDYPRNGEFVFPQFNPALGTLESVTLSLSGWSSLNFFVSAQGSGQTINGIMTVTTALTATENNATAALNLSASTDYSVDPEAGQQSYESDASGNQQTTFTDLGTLSDFTGTGTIAMYGNWGYSVSFSNPDPNLSYSFWQGGADLSGAVTYNYVQPLPEPSACTLLCAGGAVFFLLRRVRRDYVES